jgi:hypothetical protein
MKTTDYFIKQLRAIGNGFIPPNIQQAVVNAIDTNQYETCSEYHYFRIVEGKYKEWLIRLKN